MKKLAPALVAAASVAVVVVGPASAAYQSPRLAVIQGAAQTTTGPAPTTIGISTSNDDDATARVVIYAPPAPVNLSGQAAGAILGPVKAQVVALALGGATLPLTGQIQVRPADGTYLTNGQQVPVAKAATRCTGSATHAAFWVMNLSAAGQTLEVPLFVDTTTGAEAGFSAAKITVCLPPPDIPVDAGGAPFGAKLISAELTINSVFTPTTGVWFALLTPYTPATGQANQAASVFSPAAVAFASITIKTAKVRQAKRITGKLTQSGAGVPGLRVQIWGAVNRAAFKLIGIVATKRDGTYSLATKNRANTFQARATALSRPAPQLCQTQSPFPVPCVNPTVSGFSVRSATARA